MDEWTERRSVARVLWLAGQTVSQALGEQWRGTVWLGFAQQPGPAGSVSFRGSPTAGFIYSTVIHESKTNPYGAFREVRSVRSDYHRTVWFWSMLPYTDFTSGPFNGLLFQENIFSQCAAAESKRQQKGLWQAPYCREVSTFISIHLMGEPYFACHNEFEGINKHQLSGLYYNWKAECLEWVRSHAQQAPFFLLRISAVPLKWIWSTSVEMKRRKVNWCERGECLSK